VGDYEDESYVYHGLYRAADGTLTSFDAVARPNTTAESINDAGTMTGVSFNRNEVNTGWVRTAGGSIVSFNAPGAGTGVLQGTRALSINSKGNIAGFYTDGTDRNHGFLRLANGTIHRIDPPGSINTLGRSLNEKDAVTGYYVAKSGKIHGFLWSP